MKWFWIIWIEYFVSSYSFVEYPIEAKVLEDKFKTCLLDIQKRFHDMCFTSILSQINENEFVTKVNIKMVCKFFLVLLWLAFCPIFPTTLKFLQMWRCQLKTMQYTHQRWFSNRGNRQCYIAHSSLLSQWHWNPNSPWRKRRHLIFSKRANQSLECCWRNHLEA